MNVCFLCICACLCLLVYLLVSLYVSQHKCLWKVHEISVCIFSLRCNLSVWHCYLRSILAFNIEIQISYNLWIKPLHQLRLIILTFFLDLCFIPRYGCIYIFLLSLRNSGGLIDWSQRQLYFNSRSSSSNQLASKFGFTSPIALGYSIFYL